MGQEADAGAELSEPEASEQQAYGGDTESISEVIDNINSQRADVANQLSMIDSDERFCRSSA